MKVKTIKEYITNYSKGKYYFHIKDLKKYFAEKGLRFKESSLKQNLYWLKKGGFIYGAGKGWYSTLKREFLLDTKPIEIIAASIREKFPLLEFSCWSTEQLKSFFHHLPSQFVIFIHTDKDFLQATKDFLIENNYNIYLNPRKDEVEKYVELNKRTVILRPSISSREPKNQFQAKVEKILVDLLMETKKVNLLDMAEYKKIFSNIVLNYRVNMAEILDYAERRKIREKIQNTIFNSLDIPMPHFSKM